MTGREQAAREFAAVMGWLVETHGDAISFVVAATPERCAYYPLAEPDASILFRGPPRPGAPLSVHLAFVGRVAEALGSRPKITAFPHSTAVEFGGLGGGYEASDPSWACLLAATAAKRGSA